jgi:hypothetical protein
MARRQSWLMALAVLTAIVLAAPGAQGDKKALKPSKEWTGSVADEGLLKTAPAVITGAKALDDLWQSWKVGGKTPEIDFTKEIVVVTTTRGSRLSLMASLDAKGNLDVGGLATRDLRPGFRYVLAIVSRDGVRTVNGKALPGSEADKKE